METAGKSNSEIKSKILSSGFQFVSRKKNRAHVRTIDGDGRLAQMIEPKDTLIGFDMVHIFCD